MAESEKPSGGAQDKPIYRLADGVILSIGTVRTSLVDLERDFEVDVDFRHIEPLEKVSLGWTLEGFEERIPELLEEKVLAEGKPGADPVLHERLLRLDEMFLQDYRASLSARALAAYDQLVVAHARRKRFFERVGQCPVLPETALRRALLVGDADEVGAKDVLCLGDDDLVSVALAMLGHRVTVYDIDDFLLSFLRLSCDELELDVEIIERDLRDPLGDDDLEAFDVFLTDPMSNRDSFEIFLSRAFSLLRPDGVGYTAVYAPVSRLFRQIADEMRFSIEAWHARHNRYYSKYISLHDYESDWVEIKKTPELVIKHAPDAFSVPLNLYREDHFQRPKSLVSFYDTIEDVRHAMPLFLDLLLDGLESLGVVRFSDRVMHLAQDWTFIHCPMPEGYLNLHVDRARRQITLNMHPFEPTIEEPLRQLLMSAYKTGATDSDVSICRAAWDIRVR